ncbi:MAG: alcohol dehydrogenase catalytic domain-containing protein [Candidatus Helarchaeota archaeon]|nr:alcohol dehydrogenase catalytic domain-containing protein [Candidatus Helarchaeota archaeon]
MAKVGRTTVLDKAGGKFSIREMSLPDPPKPGTLLMKVEMCGVCGTDIHMWQGHEGIVVPFPAPLGHEIVGKIVALGEGVEKDNVGKPVKEGDRIVIIPLVTCGKCYACTVLQEPAKCLNALAYGHQNIETGFTGGYSEYLHMNIPNTGFLKTDIPPEVAVSLEPTSIAVSGMKRVGVTVGDTAIVQGDGAIGLLTLMVAKEAGVSRIFMVGAQEDRLKLAEEFGADLTININETTPEERIEMVKKQTKQGLGVDLVCECAGVPVAFKEGFKYLRYGGRYCELGHFTDTGSIEINPSTDICSKMATVVGSWSSLPDDFIRALQILELKKYPVGKMITHRLPLERLEDAFKAMAGDKMLDGSEIIKAVIAPK